VLACPICHPLIACAVAAGLPLCSTVLRDVLAAWDRQCLARVEDDTPPFLTEVQETRLFVGMYWKMLARAAQHSATQTRPSMMSATSRSRTAGTASSALAPTIAEPTIAPLNSRGDVATDFVGRAAAGAADVAAPTILIKTTPDIASEAMAKSAMAKRT
jgi:hypothetical protein